MLGAWADVTGASNILDIGTGTGVIALMLAQRSSARITGIEPEIEAFTIAQQNFNNSPFKDKLRVHHTSLQNFHSDTKFDLIVCNPPYFANSLKPPKANRQKQRHTDSLTQTDLIDHALPLLSTQGRFALVLPTVEGNRLMDLIHSNSLHVHHACSIFSKEGKPQERWLLEFGKHPVALPKQTQLHIMGAAGQWTTEYKALTQDFYLSF